MMKIKMIRSFEKLLLIVLALDYISKFDGANGTGPMHEDLRAQLDP